MLVRYLVNQTNYKMKTPTKFITQVDHLITTQPANKKLLHLLSGHFQLSNSQIYRKIKRITGKSPSKYIRQKRLEIAKELIEHSDLTLTEISKQVGFQQLPYFSRCFSEYFGKTASSLRK